MTTTRDPASSPADLPDDKLGSNRAYALPPLADLAQRLRDGETLAAVAASCHVTPTALKRRLNHGGWNPSGGERGPARTETMCGWCGGKTLAAKKVCLGCVSIEVSSRRGYSYEDGLRDGRWIVRGGIQVWVPDAPTGEAAA